MTEEQLKQIEQAARRTWEYIASDCESLDGWRGTHSEIWEMVGDRIDFIGGLNSETLEVFDKNYKKITKLSKGWF